MAGMAEWFYVEDDQEIGPVPPGVIRQKVQAGVIAADDEVWQVGTDDWVKARTLPGLFDASGRPAAAKGKTAARSATQPRPSGGSAAKSAAKKSSGQAKWHYAVGDEEIGPVTSAELKDQVRAGVIGPDDEVWKPGMADWTPARKIPGLISDRAKSQAKTKQRARPAAEPEDEDAWLTDLDALSDAGPALPPVVAQPSAVKAKGGGSEPLADRLSKKRPSREGMAYAGFWRRVGAFLVDALCFGGLQLILAVAFQAVLAGMQGANVPAGLILVFGFGMWVFTQIVMPVWWYAAAHASDEQATLGKRTLDIIITDLDGQRISFGRALIRLILQGVLPMLFVMVGGMIGYAADPTNGLIAGIGLGAVLSAPVMYLIQLVTPRRQALHDLICGTLVLHA